MSDVVTYHHISADPGNFQVLFEEQMQLARDIRSGEVQVDQGLAMSRPYFGAVKTLETDLRARMFGHRLEQLRRPALPDAREQSGDAGGQGSTNQ